MNKYSFSILWSDEDEEYVATCPSFPGLSALGETEEEALHEAKIALGLFIKTYEEKGIMLPEPKVVLEYSGQTRLRLPKSLHRQAAELAELDEVSLNQFLIDAIRARVAGENVSRELIEQFRQEFARTRLSVAFDVTTAQFETTRSNEAGSPPRRIYAGQPTLSTGDSRKGN